MTAIFHASLDVRSYLKAPKKSLRGLFKHPSGTRSMTPDEARDVLMDELANGHDFIPFGHCDNFDFKSGCKGHPSNKEEDSHEEIQ